MDLLSQGFSEIWTFLSVASFSFYSPTKSALSTLLSALNIYYCEQCVSWEIHIVLA